MVLVNREKFVRRRIVFLILDVKSIKIITHVNMTNVFVCPPIISVNSMYAIPKLAIARFRQTPAWII
jgi:hypothetical protein